MKLTRHLCLSLLIILILLGIVGKCFGQFSTITTIDMQQAGVSQKIVTTPFIFNCSTGLTCTWSGTSWTLAASGGAAVTDVTASSPLQSSGGTTPNISIIGSTGSTTNFVLQGSPTITTPNFTTGFKIGGAAASGAIPIGNGTNYVPSVFLLPVLSPSAGRYLKGDGTNWTISSGSASGIGSLSCVNQVPISLTLNSDAAPSGFGCTTITSAYTSGTFSASAHNLLSATHGDTTAAAVTRGAGIFGIGVAPSWASVASTAVTGSYFKRNASGDIVGSTGAASGTGALSCANQAATSITLNADAAPTGFGCATITSSFVDTSIAKTGTDINTSNQVTAPHLAAPLPLVQGGTAADLSATGGANNVLKQTAVGAAITSGTIASANLSDTANIPLENAANVFTATNTMTKAGISGTPTDALLLNNTTASTAIITKQLTPSLHFLGHVWNSTSAADNCYEWALFGNAVTGATPTTDLSFRHGIGAACAGASTQDFDITQTGVSIPLGNTYQINNTQISAANLSNGTTGTAGTAVVLATSPTLAGTVTAATVTATTYQTSTIPFFVTVSSDFTSAANTNLQTITGLAWTMPASTAMTIPFTCHIWYSQATVVSDSFGIQDVSVAPTSIDAAGWMGTSTTAQTFGNLAGLASTTATAIVTATPTVTTVNGVILSGTIIQPSNVATSAINIMVKQTTAANVIVVKKGSNCHIG